MRSAATTPPGRAAVRSDLGHRDRTGAAGAADQPDHPRGRWCRVRAAAGEICGEFGCIRNGTVWRVGPSFVQGLGFVSGCGRRGRPRARWYSNPATLVGDRGEIYQVVYGQVDRGINPTTKSMMWAFYTAPTILPGGAHAGRLEWRTTRVEPRCARLRGPRRRRPSRGRLCRDILVGIGPGPAHAAGP